MKISKNEQLCILYLSDKMEATAKMVGNAVNAVHHPSCVGAGILRSLRRKSLVILLSELRAWRLTREGRELVKLIKEEL